MSGIEGREDVSSLSQGITQQASQELAQQPPWELGGSRSKHVRHRLQRLDAALRAALSHAALPRTLSPPSAVLPRIATPPFFGSSCSLKRTSA